MKLISTANRPHPTRRTLRRLERRSMETQSECPARQRARRRSQEMARDFGADRFVPFVMLHVLG